MLNNPQLLFKLITPLALLVLSACGSDSDKAAPVSLSSNTSQVPTAQVTDAATTTPESPVIPTSPDTSKDCTKDSKDLKDCNDPKDSKKITSPDTAYAAAPALGNAGSFAVLAGASITNTGATVVSGDLGTSSGTALTEFSPGVIIKGAAHAGDAMALQAQADAIAAYNHLTSQSCNTVINGNELGGLTLTPGVYCFSSTAALTGTLTLNAQDNPNAVFIFQIASSLTTASDSSVLLINRGLDGNVFWQVGSSATLGTNSRFIGNILAQTSISLNTGASVRGRVFTRNGSVTMDTNNVSNFVFDATTAAKH